MLSVGSEKPVFKELKRGKFLCLCNQGDDTSEQLVVVVVVVVVVVFLFFHCNMTFFLGAEHG